jgi:hypothetical protein
MVAASNTTPPQVTFNLPEALQNKRLLFSGLIRLVPTPGHPGVPAVTLPYQGFAAPLQHLRLAARPAENSADGDKLKKNSGGLCYSPRATPSFYLEVMDHLAKVWEQGGVLGFGQLGECGGCIWCVALWWLLD